MTCDGMRGMLREYENLASGNSGALQRLACQASLAPKILYLGIESNCSGFRLLYCRSNTRSIFTVVLGLLIYSLAVQSLILRCRAKMVALPYHTIPANQITSTGSFWTRYV